MDTTSIVKVLLSEDNRDRELGEISRDVQNYFLKVRNLMEKDNASYDTIKEEILRNIPDESEMKPGSIAQLLYGCLKEETNDERRATSNEVNFLYEDGKLSRLESMEDVIGDETYAVVHITGNPRDITLENLKEINVMGFKKLKIKYKSQFSLSWKVFSIENLEKYINLKSGVFGNNSVFIGAIVLILALIIMSR